jgi:hypothetical protein
VAARRREFRFFDWIVLSLGFHLQNLASMGCGSDAMGIGVVPTPPNVRDWGFHDSDRSR